MTAVGMFAGRGDVVLAMLMALGTGIAIGWYLRSKVQAFKEWRAKRAALKATK